MTSTPSRPSTAVQTPQEWAAHERRIETDWNGLLINDYFNCDASAANELFEAERQELSRPQTPVQQLQKKTTIERRRESLEHKLEANGNGLLWMDWMNCDAGAAIDLWADEREQLEEVSKPKEQK